MSTEAHKAMVRRAWEEMMNDGNTENLEAFFHEDYVDHTQPPDWPTDREGLRQLVTYLRVAFPDIHVTLHDMTAEGDLVMHRKTMRATHLGDFHGIAPTGRRVEMTGTHTWRFSAGKIIEHRANNDDLGMLRQLGAIPSSSTPDAS
jgi:steroid delta-isomerase-like uncharacterized protein